MVIFLFSVLVRRVCYWHNILYSFKELLLFLFVSVVVQVWVGRFLFPVYPHPICLMYTARVRRLTEEDSDWALIISHFLGGGFQFLVAMLVKLKG